MDPPESASHREEGISKQQHALPSEDIAHLAVQRLSQANSDVICCQYIYRVVELFQLGSDVSICDYDYDGVCTCEIDA